MKFTSRIFLAIGIVSMALHCIPSHAADEVAERPVGISFSGVLGQSQPADAEPLPFVGACGVFFDKKGNLWTAAGNELFMFSRTEGKSWACSKRIALPSPLLGRAGIRWDGERAFFACPDGKLYSFDPETQAVTSFAKTGDFSSSISAFLAVVPAGLTKGYAAKGKIFLLDGIQVQAFKEDGSPSGVVLKLELPKDTARYCAIGIEPHTGDLLVASYWPGSKIYRFDVSGQQVTSAGWPRSGDASGIVTLKETAWAVLLGGGAVSLPLDRDKTEASTTESCYTMYASGMAEDPDGGRWIACSQGLVEFDKNGHATKRRLGGVAGVQSMSAADDGTLIALVENGQRIIRLAIDDEPDAVLTSNANEPFRTGAGWSNKACGLAWNGRQFLVLDQTSRQIWRFDPWHMLFGEKPWNEATQPGQFSNPSALTSNGSRTWIVDGGKVLEVNLLPGEKAVPCPVDLTDSESLGGIVSLSTSSDGSLLGVASKNKVRAYMRSSTGSYAPLWNAVEGFQSISGMSVVKDVLFVAEKGRRSVTGLSLKTGKTVAVLEEGAVKGGMMPACITGSSPWLLVADEQGRRILRFKIAN